MAKQGLEEYCATKRQIDTNEASRDIAEMRWGDQGGTLGGNAKKAALARLMSGTSGAQKRGGTSGITSQTLLQMAGQGNETPLGMLVEQTQAFTGLDKSRCLAACGLTTQLWAQSSRDCRAYQINRAGDSCK